MAYQISREKIKNELAEKIQEISGQNVFECYQCGNCSSGCPVVDYMDFMPNQVLRMSQLGQTDVILESETIWVCSTCLQCSTRCPKGIDVAKVMEAFRTIKLRDRTAPVDPNILSDEELKDLPPIALVSCFRKKTG